MTTILTKKKDTTGAPAPGDLTNSAGGAELAVNTFDKRLYTKDAGGNIVEIGTNPSTINTTTVDTTNLEVTNIKAKDGTASATIADSTGIFTHSTATVFTAGTVSAPAITTTGDTNTGIYFPAADTIAFTEGGVEAMRINSSGNVGIGTSTLAARLSINGGTGTSQTRFEVNTTEVQEVATNAAQNAYANRLSDAFQHIWKLSNVETMRLNSSGNLGVGTNNPFGKVASVANSYSPSSSAWATSAAFASTGAFGGGISLLDGSAGYTIFVQDAGATFGIAQGSTSGGTTARLVINTGGVGIGGTNDGAFGALQVVGSNYQALSVKSTNSSGVNVVLAANSATDARLNVTSNHPLVFYTNNTDRMRIDTSGNVGIGTSSPAVRLDVVGSGGGTTQLRVGDGAQQGRMAFGSVGTYGIAGGPDWGGMLFFSNSATQRMTINTSGLIGIGNTSPGFQLQVDSLQEWPIALRSASSIVTHRAVYLTQRALGTLASPTAVTSGTIIGGMAMGGHNSSTYTLGYNGGAEILAVADGTWTTTSNPTYLTFSTSPSGSSSLTERMRIDAAGNVSIGTPTASGRLTVNAGLTYLNLTAGGNAEVLKLDNSSTAAGVNTSKLSFTSAGVTKGSITTAVYNDGYMAFATNNDSEKMRIAASGAVSIGTTSAKGNCIFNVQGNTFQYDVYAGSFTGGWQTVVNIDTTFGGSCGRIRAYANENGNVNVSYGEWFFVTSSAGPQLSAQGQVTSGNSLGTAQLRISGSSLQIQNGSGSALGSWRVAFEVFSAF